MKRIFSLLLVCTMCLSMVGCSSKTNETQNAETKNAETKNAETESAETSADDAAAKADGSGVVSAAVGEPFQVDAKYGSYLITITGIEETDWWERKHNNEKISVILLNYEVENINFSSILSEGVKVEYDLFRIVDSKGGTLSPFLWYFDDVSAADTVKPGEKASGSIPYVLERNSEYFDVTFTRSTGDVAKVRVDM